MRREEERKERNNVTDDDVNSLARTFDEQCSSGKLFNSIVISTKFFLIPCLFLQMTKIHQNIPRKV
jgi:hypothetical protein